MRSSIYCRISGCLADLRKAYSPYAYGLAAYDGAEGCGYIHLLEAGSVTLLGRDRKDLLLTRPSLIFMPRPRRHLLFVGESEGAQLLCASMEFEGGVDNPLSASLPNCLVPSLDELPMLADTLKWMFREAAAAHCGIVAGRLCWNGCSSCWSSCCFDTYLITTSCIPGSWLV